MAGFELKLLHFFNQECAHPIFDGLMPLFTFIGEYNFSLALALLLFLVLRKEKKEAAVVLLAALLASGFAIFVLKTSFPRQPPFAAFDHIRKATPEDDVIHSFPSGHATCTFVVAAVLSSYFGHAGLFYMLAAVSSLSRLYGGVHYFSDIAAGAFIGSGFGYAAVYAARKLPIMRPFLKRLTGLTSR